MASKIHNDLQYALAVGWLEEFEAALARLTGTQPEGSQKDAKMQERLLAFQREQVRRLRDEIRDLSAEIREYEARVSQTTTTPPQSE